MAGVGSMVLPRLIPRSRDGTAENLLPPPTLSERHHCGIARRLIAVCRRAVLVMAEGERPHPRRPDRRGLCFHDAADDDAISEHVKVVVVPLAGGAGSRGAFEDQVVLVHRALGQKRSSRNEQMMSALHPKADKRETSPNVRFVPKADSCSAAKRIVIRSPRRQVRGACPAR